MGRCEERTMVYIVCCDLKKKNKIMKELLLHPHEDLEEASKYYDIPLYFLGKDNFYVLQQDRCVFVGNRFTTIQFIRNNEGKYCKERFPIKKDIKNFGNFD